MKDNKKKKIIIGVVVGAALALCTLVTLLGVLVYLFLYGGPATVSKDIAGYEKIFNENGLHTAYITFPEHIPEGTEKTDYYHYYRDTWNFATVETFLQCTYTPETYQKELERLQNISKTYGNQTVQLRRDEGVKYNYPAYVAVENKGYTYEYALLSGTNEITYIMTMDFHKNDVHFDAKYLPSDYMTDEVGYSIYNTSAGKDEYSNIYSRDPNPEVTDVHNVTVDGEYSMVSVFVKLDQDGNEVITSVSYSVTDAKALKTDTKEFHELDGKIYKDIKADFKEHKATITYLDGGEEKTAVYP